MVNSATLLGSLETLSKLYKIVAKPLNRNQLEQYEFKHFKINRQIQNWYPKNSTFQILILHELPFLFA